jgi:UMF1 family MFS transporter
MENIAIKPNDRKEIFGWVMYDWANSAFFTTTVGVLIGPYLISLAEKAVGAEGVVLDLYLFKVTPKGLPAFCITISVLSMIALLPVLGAIADYTNLKKKLMAFFCYLGVVASSLLFFVTDASYVWAGLFLIVSNMSFAAANVFYNAFLIDITTEDLRDRVSSYGYATGYLGGVVMLLANIFLISNAESLGISTGMAVRISFLSASVWWGLFALITFALVRSRGAAKAIPENTRLVTAGFTEIWATLKELVRLR